MAGARSTRSVEGAVLPHPWFIVNVTLTVALGLMVAAPVRAAPAPVFLTAQATVDFARPVATHSLVGFLHGLDDLQPADRLVVPLQPTLWRGSLDSAPYARAVGFGARYMLVVSDLWGYPGAGWYGRQGAVGRLGCVVGLRARPCSPQRRRRHGLGHLE